MSLTNPYGDVELAHPQAMRALAHPVRLAILSRLQRHGPSTASRLSPEVGATPSVTSWHLRHLATFGLVRDAERGEDARERWWEAVGRGFRFVAPDDPHDVEGQAAYRALTQQMFLQADELPRRWLADVEERCRRVGERAAASRTPGSSWGRRSWPRSRGRSRSCSRHSCSAMPRMPREEAGACGSCATCCPSSPRRTGRGRRAVTSPSAPAGRSLWHDRRFRTFWIGETLSQFGDRISELALPLIAVVLLDASATEIGLLTAAVWAPNLLSLFVGSWVDQREQKRPLLIGADLGRAIVLASVPVAYAVDALTLAHLFVVALLAGIGQVFFSTSYQPFFVSLVDRSRYLEANSKLSASRSVSFVAGPAVGGALVQLLTAPVAVLVDALTFVASAVQIARVRVEERPVESTAEPLLRRALDGLRIVLRHPYLRASLGCATTLNFFTFIAQALLVLFASRTLGLSAGVIGLAFGIGALGGLLGAVVAPRLAHRFGVGPIIVVGAILFPAPIAFLALAGGPDWVGGVGARRGRVRLGTRGDAVRRQPQRAPDDRHARRRSRPCERRVHDDQLRHPPARRSRRRSARHTPWDPRDDGDCRDRRRPRRPLAPAVADPACPEARRAGAARAR